MYGGKRNGLSGNRHRCDRKELIADYLGATNSLVYRYMRGEVLPSTDRLLALSVLLGITVNDLLVTS